MAKGIKVIWLSNVILPEASEALGLPKLVIGSWLIAYKAILEKYYPSDITLHIIAPYQGTDFKTVRIGNTSYYVFPKEISPRKLKAWLKETADSINPDIVHLHGSEFPHSSMLFDICPHDKVLLSIQGLVGVCARYYYAGLDLDNKFTIRDVLKHNTLRQQRQLFARRGMLERSLLQKLSYVAGRTSWDRAHCLAVNPRLKYFICNEPLREGFYQAQWSIDKCQRHTIFACQPSYPIKGLHMLLEALPLIRRRFPDVKLNLPGVNLCNSPWYKMRAYWKYIGQLINKHQLEDCIRFLGNLPEEEMIAQYLSANVFVCPSSIENSSNSVCEAQIIGTPLVASYVGGMMELVEDGKTGLLYRFEEVEMLADKVCHLFANESVASEMSRNERLVAAQRHDRRAIADSLMGIYDEILNNSDSQNGRK